LRIVSESEEKDLRSLF